MHRFAILSNEICRIGVFFVMRRYHILLIGLILCSSHVVASCPPQKASEGVPEVPIESLRSFSPPKDTVWVRGTIVARTSDDTYLLEDHSGQITVFLQSEELMNLDLRPHMEILVFGHVDISNVNPSKNELYAERILLPPAKGLCKSKLSDLAGCDH
jgi:uncharacterized protein YdeI (BOF family)